MTYNSLYAWLGVSTPFDPQSRFVTSYLLAPFWLFVWRAVIAVYVLVTIVLVYALTDGAKEFSYFTVLSYWGVLSYFVVSAAHTLSFWLAYRRWQQSRGGLREKFESDDGEQQRRNVNTSQSPDPPRSWLARSFPRPLQFLHCLLFSTICTYPLVVTVIYWVLLSSAAYESVQSTWQNISIHAFNMLFTGLDVAVLGRGPMMPWSACFFNVFMLACYVGVAYITYADQHFYPYDFLDQGKNGTGVVSGYVIGIGVACVVSFMIGQFLIFLREYVAAKVQGSGQWGSAKPAGVLDDALIATQRGPGPEGEGGQRRITGQTQGWRQRWPTDVRAA